MDDTYPMVELQDNGDFAKINVRLVLPGTAEHRRESEFLDSVIGGPHSRRGKSRGAFIEFYDRDGASTPYGHRICGYFLETLLESRDVYEANGLNLHGGVDAWTLTPEAFSETIRWAEERYKKG
jgi:hypothetical protein